MGKFRTFLLLIMYNLLWGNLGHFCYWLAKYFYSCCKLYVITLYNLLWGNLGHFYYWLVKYFYSCCTLYVLTLYNLLWGNLGHFKCMFRCRYLLWNYQIRLLIVQCNGQVWDKAKVQWSLKTKILNHAIFENLNLGTLLFHEYGKGFWIGIKLFGMGEVFDLRIWYCDHGSIRSFVKMLAIY